MDAKDNAAPLNVRNLRPPPPKKTNVPQSAIKLSSAQAAAKNLTSKRLYAKR